MTKRWRVLDCGEDGFYVGFGNPEADIWNNVAICEDEKHARLIVKAPEMVMIVKAVAGMRFENPAEDRAHVGHNAVISDARAILKEIDNG